MSDFEMCAQFLCNNGWDRINAEETNREYDSFCKDGYFGVDINDSEIVIISDIGDIQHLPVDIYALIGYLFDKRQIDCSYKR